MTRELSDAIDNALYEALRDFCGPDKAVGAVEVVKSVLFRHEKRNPRVPGCLVLPTEETVVAESRVGVGVGSTP